MANVTTLKNLDTIFKDIVDRYFELNGYGWGDDAEIGAAEVNYPLLWVNPTSVDMIYSEANSRHTQIEFTFNIKCLDLVKKDRKDEVDTTSDTMQTLINVVNELNGHPFFQRSDLQLLDDVTFESVKEFSDDETYGHQGDIKFRIANSGSFCGIPATDIVGFRFPGPELSAITYNTQFLTCRTVTGCTELQNFVAQQQPSASNGLTKINNVITLGGTLTGDTFISNAGFNLASDSFSANTIIANRVNAPSGFGQLDLRNGADNTVLLSTDGGGQNESGFFANSTEADIFADAFDVGITVSASQIELFHTGSIESNRKINFQVGNGKPFIIHDNTTDSRISNNVDNVSIFIGTNASTMNSGITNSVILGGVGLTGYEDDTAYMDNANSKVLSSTTISAQTITTTDLKVNGAAVLSQVTGTTTSALSIDWGASNNFSHVISANTEVSFSNDVDGQTVVIAVSQDTPAGHNLSWSGITGINVALKWQGGTEPTFTATSGATDVFTFTRIESTIYGAVIQDFS